MHSESSHTDRDRQMSLIVRYIEDDLSSDELTQFNAQLRQDKSLRTGLVEHCTREALLRETLAPESQMSSDVDELDEFVRKSQVARAHRRRIAWGGTAVATLAVFIGLFLVFDQRGENARIRVEGSIALIRDGQRHVAVNGMMTQQGDRYEVADQSSMTLKYDDGTTVEVGGDAAIVVDSRASGGKRIVLERGGLQATVAPQLLGRAMMFGTPTAEAEVLGTQFTLLATSESTRLRVSKGSVRLARRSDEESVVVDAANVGVVTEGRIASRKSDWPSNRDGIVVQVQPDGPTGAVAVCDQGRRAYPIQKIGNASIENGRMLLGEGKLAADAVAERVRMECQRTNELSIELTFETSDLEQRGPARIITLSSESKNHSFTIGHNHKQLVWRLRTDGHSRRPGDIGIKLMDLSDINRHHLIVSYRGGETVCFVDGELVHRVAETTGGFSNWTPQHLLFGNEWGEDRSWKGAIEGIVIYNRFIGDAEAKQNATAYRRLWKHDN